MKAFKSDFAPESNTPQSLASDSTVGKTSLAEESPDFPEPPFTEAEVLARLIERLNTPMAPEPRLEQLLNDIRKATGATHAALFCPHKEGPGIEVRTLSGYTPQEEQELQQHLATFNPELIGQLFRVHQLLRIAPEKATPARSLGLPNLATTLLIPVLHETEVLGLASLQSPAETAFQKLIPSFLQALISSLALALASTRLQQAEQQQRELAETLQDVGAILAAAIDTESMLDRLLDQIGRIVPHDAANVMLIEGENLRVAHSRGYGAFGCQETIQIRERPLREFPSFQWMLKTGEPLIVPDTRAHPRWIPMSGTEWLRSYAAVPITIRGTIIGFLNVDSATPGFFGARDAEKLRAFADQAAIALENARLFREVQAERERLALLYEISRRLGSAPTLEQVAQIVTQLAPQVHAEYGDLFLFNPGGQPFIYSSRPEGLQIPPEKTTPFIEKISSVGLEGWVLRHRQSALVVDTETDPRWLRITEDLITNNIHSVVCLPLFNRHEEALGILSYSHTQPYAFGPPEQRLAEEIGQRVAVTLENNHLSDEFIRRLAREEQLNTLAHTLGREMDLPTLASRLLPQLILLVGADGGTLHLLAGPALPQGHYHALLPGEMPPCTSPATLTLAPYTLQVRQPVLMRDYRQHPAAQSCWIQSGVRSLLSVPLLAGDEILGGLEFFSLGEVRPFSPEAVAAAQAAARLTSVAIQRVLLFEAEHRRHQEAETLREIALTLTTALESEEVIERILGQLRTVVPYDSASVQMLQGQELEIVGGWGFSDLTGVLGARLSLNDNIPNTAVIHSRTPQIVPDALSRYATFRQEPHARARIRSWLGVPMVVGDRMIGMIALDKQEPDFYTLEHARLAQVFAIQAAVALENSRLFQAERLQRQRAEALAEAAAATSNSLDPEQVLDSVLEHVARIVPGDSFSLMFLVDSNRVELMRWQKKANQSAAQITVHLNMSFEPYVAIRQMQLTGKPYLIQDTLNDPDWIPKPNLQWVRSYVGAPIRSGGLTMGFLNINGRRPAQFDALDAQRLAAFAAQLATTLQNARLYRELQSRAGDLEEQVRLRTAQIQVQYARLEAILSSTSDGILVTDETGALLENNVVAQNWLIRLSPADMEKLQHRLRDLAGRAAERPQAMLELEGLDLELNAAPVTAPDVEKAVVVIAAHDVTRLKELDRMKSRFVSNVSHELRTPITAIKLYAEMLRKGKPERREEYLDTLETEVDRQARLIEDLLSISRIDAGKLELRPARVSLNYLAGSVVNGYQLLAQHKGLTLTLETSEPEARIPMDHDKMLQVLNNLVENAIRYTPPGGRITVRTGRQQLEGRAWHTLQVSDTGLGISPEDLPHIFERFYRGERPRQMQIPGTGLGLAIVKELVDLHGGRITAESQCGRETRFTVWLPEG